MVKETFLSEARSGVLHTPATNRLLGILKLNRKRCQDKKKENEIAANNTGKQNY